jgi:uncharacterized membrane protein
MSMSLLILGLLLWSGIHLFPSVAVDVRTTLVSRFGMKRYKGIFALLIVLSIVLIVLGWRATVPIDIYQPPVWGRHITWLLVLLTFILIVARRRKTNIKRILRHPMLTGLVLWGIGHLLANGDNRSLLLFIWLGLWAVIEIILINRREGQWQKPDPEPVKNDVITVGLGIVLFTVFLLLHAYIAGVSLIST